MSGPSVQAFRMEGLEGLGSYPSGFSGLKSQATVSGVPFLLLFDCYHYPKPQKPETECSKAAVDRCEFVLRPAAQRPKPPKPQLPKILQDPTAV